MSKIKISVKDKIYAVNLYLDKKESQHRIASMFDVSLASVQQWIRNYESMGKDAFALNGYKRYSKELKQLAVSDYLAGYGSQDIICTEEITKPLTYTGDTGWQPGVHYIYNILIGTDEILIEPTVAEWEPKNNESDPDDNGQNSDIEL